MLIHIFSWAPELLATESLSEPELNCSRGCSLRLCGVLMVVLWVRFRSFVYYMSCRRSPVFRRVDKQCFVFIVVGRSFNLSFLLLSLHGPTHNASDWLLCLMFFKREYTAVWEYFYCSGGIHTFHGTTGVWWMRFKIYCLFIWGFEDPRRSTSPCIFNCGGITTSQFLPCNRIF